MEVSWLLVLTVMELLVRRVVPEDGDQVDQVDGEAQVGEVAGDHHLREEEDTEEAPEDPAGE